MASRARNCTWIANAELRIWVVGCTTNEAVIFTNGVDKSTLYTVAGKPFRLPGPRITFECGEGFLILAGIKSGSNDLYSSE